MQSQRFSLWLRSIVNISKVSFYNLYCYAIAKPDVTLPDSRPISSEIASYVPYLPTAPLVDVLSFSQSHSSEAGNQFPMHEVVPYPSSYSKRAILVVCFHSRGRVLRG